MSSRIFGHAGGRAAQTLALLALSLLAGMAQQSFAAGTLLIDEFRWRGPGGANDEYIQIYNNSGAAHTVTSLGGTGYAIAASDGVVRCTIPNGTVIPDRGHFLCAHTGFSNTSYPAGNGTTSTPDATYSTEIPGNVGIALFNNNLGGGSFILANRFDAVGATTEANTLYREGAGLPPITPTFDIEYALTRDTCGKGGAVNLLGPCTITTPKDTDDNAADFYFVDANGTSAGAGQRLGAPGPRNLSSPIAGATGIGVALLDSCAAEAVAPNFVRVFTSDPSNNSTFGTLELRRTFTNNTGANITRLRFRIIDLDTFPAASGFADLRPRTSTSGVVTVDRPPCGSGTSNVTVEGTTLEQDTTAPSFGQPNGGGFNSSLGVPTITLGTPLANGASIDVRFLFGIQQTGNMRVAFVAETLPAAGVFFQVNCGSDGCTTPTVSSITLSNPNPTNAASVQYGVSFSEAVTGVDVADFALATTGAIAGASVTGISGGPVNYTVTVNTGTGSGTLGLNVVDNDSIVNAPFIPLGGPGAGNGNFTGPVYTIDKTGPTVTINQAGAQADPTGVSPINFTVTFSESVTGFAAAGVGLSGTAGATTKVVTGSGAVYNVAVSGMTASGSVTATVNAGAVADALGNPSTASTSIDNTVTFALSVTSFTGPTGTGTGNATASFTGGGGACTFSAPQFIGAPPGAPPIPPVAVPGFTFPQGLFTFTTTGCIVGSTLSFTIVYPQALPPGAVYWKYGPTLADPSAHWYVLPATIIGNTATFTIADGGLGDDDLAANGTIVDQGGPGVPVAGQPIPALDMRGLILLMLMMMLGVAAMRRRA